MTSEHRLREIVHRRGRARFLPAIAFAAAVLAVSSCGRRPAEAPADIIFEGGTIATMDAAAPRAEAVAVRAGRVVFAGPLREIRRFAGPDTRLVDLRGRMLLPAFQDSHVHLVMGGVESLQCNLAGLKTREEVFARITAYAAANPGRAWVLGGGWDLPIFPQANPRKDDLDALVPDRPAALGSADGHSLWLNSRALAAAKITAATPDPPAGRIERTPGTREPSGTLRETAQRLVDPVVPPLTPGDYLQGLRAGMALAHRLGIVSIIEARADDAIAAAYETLDRSGELRLNASLSLEVDPRGDPAAETARVTALRTRLAGRRIKADEAKIFIDGVVEAHTAVLLAPYLDRPGDRGEPRLDAAAMRAMAIALDAAGFQIHVHAIGDGAVRMALDAFEAAAAVNGRRDARHHVAHLEMIDPADVPRFAGLGVVADFQALWAQPDLYITDLTQPILGPERSARLYPIGEVAASGATIAGGSDWSVSSMDPLEAVQEGVTRRRPEDGEGPAWLPEQAVTLQRMLEAYTIGGAFVARREKEAGSIEAGKKADLVVLDRDLYAVPATRIREARVLWTLLDGAEVYRSRDWKEPPVTR